MNFERSWIFLFGLVAVLYVSTTTATTCYSCEGQACLRTTQENVTKVCSVAADPCIAVFDGFMPIIKGCYSDLSTSDRLPCDQDSDVTCYKCAVDHCNNMGRVDHKCKVCIATSSNSTCLNDPQIMSDTRCKAPRTQDVFCSTSIINGNTTRRACVTSYREIYECLNNSTTCSICSVSSAGACNSVINFPENRRRCLYCSGDNCQMTNSSTTSATPRYCPKVDDRCVSINLHGVFERKCASEISVEDNEYCTKYNTSCLYCTTDSCNVAVPPSSATALWMSAKLVVVMAVAVWFSSAK